MTVSSSQVTPRDISIQLRPGKEQQDQTILARLSCFLILFSLLVYPHWCFTSVSLTSEYHLFWKVSGNDIISCLRQWGKLHCGSEAVGVVSSRLVLPGGRLCLHAGEPGPAEDRRSDSFPPHEGTFQRFPSGVWIICGQASLSLYRCASFENQKPLQVSRFLKCLLWFHSLPKCKGCFSLACMALRIQINPSLKFL